MHYTEVQAFCMYIHTISHGHGKLGVCIQLTLVVLFCIQLTLLVKLYITLEF